MRRAFRRDFVPELVPERTLITSLYTMAPGETLSFFEVRNGGSILVTDNVTLDDGIVVPSAIGSTNHGIRTNGTSVVSNVTVRNIVGSYTAGSNRVIQLTKLSGVNLIENVNIDGASSGAITPLYTNLEGNSTLTVNNFTVVNSTNHGFSADVTVNEPTSVKTLNINNASISNSAGHGLQVQSNAGQLTVNVDASTFNNNGSRGMFFNSYGTFNDMLFRVNVENSFAQTNGNAGLAIAYGRSGTDAYHMYQIRAHGNTFTGNNTKAGAERDLYFVSNSTAWPYGLDITGNTIGIIGNSATIGNFYIEGTQDLSTVNTVITNSMTAGSRKEVPVGFVALSDRDAQRTIRNMSTGTLAISQTAMNALNTLISGIKSNNLWTNLVCFYPQIGLTSNAMAYGFKSTGVLSRVGTNTLSEAGGSQPADTSSYTTTTENAVGLTAATYFADMLSVGSSQYTLFTGEFNGVGYDDTYGLYGSYGPGTDIIHVEVFTSGLMCFSYDATADSNLYHNGVLKKNAVNESGTVIGPNASLSLNRYTSGYFPSTHRIGSFGYFNKALSSTEQANLYSLVSAFNTSIGRS